MTHDKFCEYEGEITYPCGQCATIAAVRADERKKAPRETKVVYSNSKPKVRWKFG